MMRRLGVSICALRERSKLDFSWWAGLRVLGGERPGFRHTSSNNTVLMQYGAPFLMHLVNDEIALCVISFYLSVCLHIYIYRYTIYI